MEKLRWITVNGVHVPIMPGQNQDEAIKEFIETRNKLAQDKEKSADNLKRDNMWYVDSDENRKAKAIKPILDYYGYKTIEEASKDLGYSGKDTIRALIEMYADDTAPDTK